MASRRKSRRIAVQGLYGFDVGKMSADRIQTLDWVTDSETFDPSFARLLIHGTLEHIATIDASIEEHLDHWELSRLHRVDLAILRVSTYSLLFQTDIPAHVTIDEAVELAKEMSTDDAYRFINGVLDGIRKDSDNAETP